jgi:tRNA U34 5-methylaminomethyl-2-thiouridine-forming methyltransferase MnmC
MANIAGVGSTAEEARQQQARNVTQAGWQLHSTCNLLLAIKHLPMQRTGIQLTRVTVQQLHQALHCVPPHTLAVMPALAQQVLCLEAVENKPAASFQEPRRK